MPAAPPTPVGVIRARMQFAVDDDTNLGTKFDIGYTGGPPDSSELATIAGLVNTSYGDNLGSFLSTHGLLDGTFCKDLANPSTVEGFSVSGDAGTRSGNMATVGVAAVIFFRPDRAYRGSRPKMFTPFGVEGDVTAANSWAGSFVTALQLAANAFFAALAGEGAGSTVLTTPKSVSYYHGFTVVTSGTTGRARNVPTLRATPLVVGTLGLEVQQRLGSQRRRLAAA